MRILLLIIQYPPDTNPTGRLMARLVDGLRAAGHHVDVITALPHYEHFRIRPEMRGRLFIHERGPQGSVLRLWVYANGRKDRMLHRLISYLSFNVLATLAGLLRRQRYAIILAPNGSFFTGISAAIIGGLRRTPFIYNVQDLYPEVPVQAGQLTSPRAIAGLERLERLMYRLATHVSVIAPAFHANLLRKGVPPDRVSHIPNFVDTTFIKPLPRQNSFSAASGLDQRFVVCYAGNLGYVYDLENVLKAAELLNDYPDILFLIVGEGVSKAALLEQAARLNLQHVRFLPFQSLDQLPLLRASADVQLSPHRPGTTGYSLPSKIYEALSSGRPILVCADADSDVARLIAASGCGRCLPPGDPQALASAILELRADPVTRARMGAAGRRYAEQHHSPTRIIEQYTRLFEHIVVGRQP